MGILVMGIVYWGFMGIIVNCDNVMGIFVIGRMYKEVVDVLIVGYG